MSLVVPGLGRTTTVKPRRPRPKPAMPVGGNRPKPVLKPAGPTTKPKRPLKGKVTANPYVTDKKPRPKLGSKPRSGKVTPVPGIVNDKPTPKAPSKPKRPLVGRPTSSGGGKRRPTPSMSASRPKRPLRAPKRGSGRPMASSGKTGRFSGKRYTANQMSHRQSGPVKKATGKKLVRPSQRRPSGRR